MTAPDQPLEGPGDGRARYLVGVWKLAPADRDLFRELHPDAAALAAASWLDAHGAMDDETRVAVGEPAVYSVEWTPEQVARAADAENLRWLELAPRPLTLPTPNRDHLRPDAATEPVSSPPVEDL